MVGFLSVISHSYPIFWHFFLFLYPHDIPMISRENKHEFPMNITCSSHEFPMNSPFFDIPCFHEFPWYSFKESPWLANEKIPAYLTFFILITCKKKTMVVARLFHYIPAFHPYTYTYIFSPTLKLQVLSGGLEPWNFEWLSHHIGNFIISTDFRIFFRGVVRKTTNQVIINHH